MQLADAADDLRTFDVFIRQSLEFAEDFSLGLVYHSPNAKRMTLVRYNGQHEQTNDPLSMVNLHFQYHIHAATPLDLNNGRYDKHGAQPTPAYASFEEATGAFLTRIGMKTEDVMEFFPAVTGQLFLFQNMGTQQ